MAPTTGEKERRAFYSMATHVLFAIVIGHSFTLAPGVVIPIDTAFEPDKQAATITLLFTFLVIVAGWLSYARSVSRHPHRDTGWGVVRFILNILVLFEYFYLLEILQTDYVADVPLVVWVIFMTYALSDSVKVREWPRYRKRLRRQAGRTWGACVVMIITMAFGDSLNVEGLTLGLLAILVVGFTAVTWRPPTSQ